MHTQEQLAEGLHMIDFEQLKINNMDLNEKIEERNEDILKLKRKVTSTVQVLTHVKEKLQFLQVPQHKIYHCSALFPGSSPVFCCILPGNEATCTNVQ